MSNKKVLTGKSFYRRLKNIFDEYMTDAMHDYIPKFCRYTVVRLYEMEMVSIEDVGMVKDNHMEFFNNSVFDSDHYIVSLQMLISDILHSGSFGDIYRYQYSKYLDSQVWKMITSEVKNRDDHICSMCGKSDMHKDFIIPRKLHVHHKSYDNVYIEPIEDLTTLCRSCHEVQHGHK